MLEPKTSSARGPSSVPSDIQQLVRRPALAGQRLRRHAPHPGDVLAGRRVVDHPVAGQLVGLLPVLAAALAVALPGQAAVAGVRRAALPERQRDVDPREHRVRALRVLLGAARGQHHHLAPRSPSSARQRDAPRRRHAGHPLDPLRPPRGDRAAYLVEAGGARGDVLLVDLRRPRPARAARPSARARSVPGTGWTNTSARSAVGVRRGSITTTLPPRARRASRWRAAGGMVSARFEPTSTSTSVCSMSASGNGSPRSTPNARLPADAADDMHHRPL